MEQNFWGTQAGNGPVRITATVALAVFTLFLLAETVLAVQGWGSTPQAVAANTITVSGEGSATAIPDTATVSYTITKTEATVAQAQADVTKVEDAALAFLKTQSIEDKDVRTTSYSINPHYVYHPCTNGFCPPATISGYDVSQTISVKLHDTKTVGTIIGGLGTVGVSNLSGPSFSVNDPTSVKDQARAEAITKAKAQAQTLAKQLGVQLVRITHYVETTNTPSPIVYGMGGAVNATKAEAAPSVPTGENEYTANVSITYEIR